MLAPPIFRVASYCITFRKMFAKLIIVTEYFKYILPVIETGI